MNPNNHPLSKFIFLRFRVNHGWLWGRNIRWCTRHRNRGPQTSLCHSPLNTLLLNAESATILFMTNMFLPRRDDSFRISAHQLFSKTIQSFSIFTAKKIIILACSKKHSSSLTPDKQGSAQMNKLQELPNWDLEDKMTCFFFPVALGMRTNFLVLQCVYQPLECQKSVEKQQLILQWQQQTNHAWLALTYCLWWIVAIKIPFKTVKNSNVTVRLHCPQSLHINNFYLCF